MTALLAVACYNEETTAPALGSGTVAGAAGDRTAAGRSPDVDIIVNAPTSEYQNVPKRSDADELASVRAQISERF